MKSAPSETKVKTFSKPLTVSTDRSDTLNLIYQIQSIGSPCQNLSLLLNLMSKYPKNNIPTFICLLIYYIVIRVACSDVGLHYASLMWTIISVSFVFFSFQLLCLICFYHSEQRISEVRKVLKFMRLSSLFSQVFVRKL